MRLKAVLLVTMAVLSNTIPGVLYAQNMPGTATYDGHVLFEGQPVEGAEVLFYEYTSSENADDIVLKAKVLTSTDGSFSSPQPADDHPLWYVIAQHPDYSIGFTGIYTDTNPNDITINLYEPVAITGIVRSSDGDVLPDVEIRIGNIDLPMSMRRTTLYSPIPELTIYSNTDGQYSFDKLPTNARVNLSARKTGYTTYGRFITVLTNKSENDIYLDPASTISGHVFNRETGEPVANAALEISEQPPVPIIYTG